jgi:hypothetical protein
MENIIFKNGIYNLNSQEFVLIDTSQNQYINYNYEQNVNN